MFQSVGGNSVFINNLFNPDINQDFEFLLFNYNFMNNVHQWKAI